MLKSSSNAQDIRLSHSNRLEEASSVESMDTLKTTFLPNLSMESGVLQTAHFCPTCGLQFERAHHVTEHHMLCHGGIGVVAGVGHNSGLVLTSSHHANVSNDPLKIDYPCLNCDDKFPTAEDLDDHNRVAHQAFLARCSACGIYGISSVSMNEGDEFKCMNCGSICTASSLTSGQATYIEQQQQEMSPQTPENLPSLPPEELNTITPDDSPHHMQSSIRHQQHQQHHQQQQQRERQNDRQLKVPPITVKINKNPNGNGEFNPQVIVKQEPMNDANEDSPTTVPVYTIQQTAGATSVVVSTAAFDASTNSNSNSNTVIIGNKVRHKCPECPKTFKTPGTLNMHRKIHTGDADVPAPKERPFTCSYCGKSFTQSNTLKQHTRIHTGEKPYHCGYCEKSFSVKDYLTKHIRTHTGEKPYSCSYCDKRFTQRSALTVHTTKLHPT